MSHPAAPSGRDSDSRADEGRQPPGISLAQFVEDHHYALVARCRIKLAARMVPTPTELELDHGIPLLLDHLSRAVRAERVTPLGARRTPSAMHAGALLARGFTPAQLVHDYADACRSITQLAMELQVTIPADDFRALDLALDDAIADAVTEHSRRRDVAASAPGAPGADEHLGRLAHGICDHLSAATLAFEALRHGTVGGQGSTGAVLARSLAGMRELANNALAEVRLAAGLHRREPIVVRELIEEVEISILMEAKARDLSLTVAPGPADCVVQGDRQILGCVVSNLLQNALKFTRPGGEVSLTTRTHADRVAIEIEDECGGLPAGMQERLLRPFDPDSAGTGLAICRRGVEALGATMGVRDLPQQGCRFTVDLPRGVCV